MTPEQQEWLNNFKKQPIDKRQKIIKSLIGKPAFTIAWKAHREASKTTSDLIKDIFFKEEK